MLEPVGSVVHSGAHVLALPEQFELPPASNAYSRPSSEPTYTTPFATAGEEFTAAPVAPVHKGSQELPEQLLSPAASNA
jgi:hypothetical protein